jgi:threonine/homoserine/homoserine lactone efflux protein
MDTASLLTFAQAVLVGLSIAAPVGPIGLLTIQRTLAQGRRAGLATGLGAAAVDACYGALGAFGVQFVIGALVSLRGPLSLLGGGVLGWMAWRTWRQPVAERAAELATGGDLLRNFAGTFLLTLSNPATIFSFLAVFSALAGGTARPLSPLWMVAGVGLGSALWWWMLTWTVGRLRHRLDAAWRQRINRVSGALLGAIALWALAQAAASGLAHG